MYTAYQVLCLENMPANEFVSHPVNVVENSPVEETCQTLKTTHNSFHKTVFAAFKEMRNPLKYSENCTGHSCISSKTGAHTK